MSLLLAWLVFPAVMLALCLGCGLLADRAAGRGTIDGPLLAPAGLATLIVIAGLLTMQGGTARAATPACALAAVVGYALNHQRLRRVTRNRWLIVVAATAFLAYAAPILFTGSATFAGYIKLDDTATWMAMTDRVMTHGRDLSGVAPSTYSATLAYTLGSGYPLGSLVPWGVGAALTGQDLAWVFQPYLAFLGALLAMTAYALLGPFFSRRWTLATAAFVASQPALLYAYSLWGGIKEMTAAVCIALTAAVVPALLRRITAKPLRSVLPIAIAAAATLVTLTVGGALWLIVVLAATFVIVAATKNRRTLVRATASFVVLGAALAIPALRTANYVLRSGTGFTEQGTSSGGGGGGGGGGGAAAAAAAPSPDQIATALGNLIHPLSTLQVFGIWPASDFRTGSRASGLTHVLIAVLILTAVLGLAYAIRRRAWGVALYGTGTAIGCLVLAHYGSPWVDGKAMATASPMALVLAAAAIGVMVDRVHPAIPIAVAAALTIGVLWSNVLAYGGVNVAPRGQLHELQQIGEQFAGKGPALLNEYQPYGVRHFLRHLDAEAPSELRIRPVFLVRGGSLSKAQYADIDEFQYPSLAPYNTLVLRRSPSASRPPSSFKLARAGHWYDVWERDPAAPEVLAHLGAGTPVEPTGIIPCTQVKQLAKIAGPSGRLATVFRAPAVVYDLNTFSHPAAWTDPAGADLLPGTTGSAKGQIYVANPGTYHVWVGGSVRSRLTVLVDGLRIGSATNQLNVNGQWTDYGSTSLGPGNHTVELRSAGPDLVPGSAGLAPPLGPLELSLGADNATVTYLATSHASSLCGRAVDWIEAVK
jgi:hypothetical protein